MTKVFRSFVLKQQRSRTADAQQQSVQPGHSRVQPGQSEQGEDKSRRVNPETGEVGGPDGPEPTRYGDWERGGVCYDF